MTPAEFIDDPEWWKFLPEAPETQRPRHLPAHEDCTPVDPDAAASHILAGGVLGAMPGYEERPGQISMLKAVAHAYACREHLMAEAGTGVGKSLAYLIPSVLWASRNDTTVVVSTATRVLQSQLVNSDIPKALAVLGGDAGGFKTALLKGRTNYLCLRALDEFFSPGYWTMSKADREAMPAFIKWLKTTPDGDLEECVWLDRQSLSCPGEECGGRRCRFHSRCFVNRARKNAAAAHLVVANHALVLTDSLAGSGAILPPHSRIVLDEAHNLESIATDCFAAELSQPALKRITDRLHRPGRGKSGRSTGALAAVERALAKGAPRGTLDAALASLSASVKNMLAKASRLMDTASALLAHKGASSPLRFKTRDGLRCFSAHGVFKQCDSEIWSEEALVRARNSLEDEIAGAVHTLHAMRDEMDAADAADGVSWWGDAAAQIAGVADRLVEFANTLYFTLSGDNDNWAYWIERVKTPERRAWIRIVAAPLDVSERLEDVLYSKKDSAILCSATLRTGNDFKYMSKRLGCDGARFAHVFAPSPFDYLRQAAVLATDWTPDPQSDISGYAAAVAEIVEAAAKKLGGRTLTLFTSYEMMNAVAAARPALENAGLSLLVQGEGLSRQTMTAELKKNGGAGTVLFGAQSFWEGVDVPGAALSCVIIARLPFPQVRDPIIEARAEKIEREGGSSFREYLLPEAVIRFRQGFGRLVRSKRDCGTVIVADPRIVTKNYGASFRKSIPASVHTVSCLGEMLERMHDT